MVTRQVPCARVPRRRAGRHVGRRAARTARQRARCAGRAGTWCSRRRARRAAAPGRQRSQRCAVCGGHGRARAQRSGDGARAGRACATATRLRIAGARATPDATAARTGDLYVTVHVQPHPLFRREGDDLLCTVPIAVHEAVLGARIEVPSLDGPVRLRISAGHAGRASGSGSAAAASRRPSGEPRRSGRRSAARAAGRRRRALEGTDARVRPAEPGGRPEGSERMSHTS